MRAGGVPGPHLWRENMKKIMPVIFLAILLPAGIVAMGNPPAGREQFLSSADARKSALDGYNRRSWAFPSEYARSMKGARAGAPLLVERLDMKNSFYFIVPFERAGKATLLVMIDAKTGEFKEAVPLAQPSAYPPVSANEAKKSLADSSGSVMPEGELARLKPSLVWKPSEQSQSPFEPLWRFRTGHGDRYVDQKGKVHPSIEEPHLKGG